LENSVWYCQNNVRYWKIPSGIVKITYGIGKFRLVLSK